MLDVHRRYVASISPTLGSTSIRDHNHLHNVLLMFCFTTFADRWIWQNLHFYYFQISPVFMCSKESIMRRASPHEFVLGDVNCILVVCFLVAWVTAV